MQDIAEKGEWEKIDGQLEALLLTMDRVRSLNFRHQAIAAHPEQAEQVLQHLHAMIDLCSARKEQISPLIAAFANTPEAPPEP